MRNMKWRGAALLLAGMAGGSCAVGARATVPEGPNLPAPPWAGAALERGRVPDAYATAWSEAPNRESCALLAPASVEPAQATARRATFGGGWGVAYDLPELRSAFGVAGTGASAGGDVYDDWPHELTWSDGSRAGYGPEGGGAGSNQLAYLTIPGQDCLYNVWSRLGVEHLERLLGELRFVR